jgi:hypothetical protein
VKCHIFLQQPTNISQPNVDITVVEMAEYVEFLSIPSVNKRYGTVQVLELNKGLCFLAMFHRQSGRRHRKRWNRSSGSTAIPNDSMVVSKQANDVRITGCYRSECIPVLKVSGLMPRVRTGPRLESERWHVLTQRSASSTTSRNGILRLRAGGGGKSAPSWRIFKSRPRPTGHCGLPRSRYTR